MYRVDHRNSHRKFVYLTLIMCKGGKLNDVTKFHPNMMSANDVVENGPSMGNLPRMLIVDD